MPIAGLCLLVAGFVLWTMARFQLGIVDGYGAGEKTGHAAGSIRRFAIRFIFSVVVMAGLVLVSGRPVWLLIFLVFIPLQIWRGREEAKVLEESLGKSTGGIAAPRGSEFFELRNHSRRNHA